MIVTFCKTPIHFSHSLLSKNNKIGHILSLYYGNTLHPNVVRSRIRIGFQFRGKQFRIQFCGTQFRLQLQLQLWQLQLPQNSTTYHQKAPITQYVCRIYAQIAVRFCSIYVMPKAVGDILTVKYFYRRMRFFIHLACVCHHTRCFVQPSSAAKETDGCRAR